MKRLIVVGALACALAAVPLSASTFLAMQDSELVAQSDVVVVGEVLYTYSYWNREGTMVFTDAVVHVQDSVLGKASGLLTVRTPGGQIAGFRVEAEGFPAFGAGQRQVLFLHHVDDGVMEVTGYQQGQYRVITRSDGVEVAVPALKGARLLNASGTPAPLPHAMELASLKHAIRIEAQALDRQSRVK